MRGVKISYGIALCDKDSETRMMRILLANRRYTYAFTNFVHGHYVMSDRAIIDLFDAMTLDEKLDILSMDFRQMWYRVWLGQQIFADCDLYKRSMVRFVNRFCAAKGEYLRALMAQSTKSAKRPWEVPKGRRRQSETCLDCAIREFREETGIPRSAYHLTNGRFMVSFDDGGVRYETHYFIAITGRKLVPQVNILGRDQVAEISELEFVSGQDLGRYLTRDVEQYRRAMHYAKRALRRSASASPSARASASALTISRVCDAQRS